MPTKQTVGLSNTSFKYVYTNSNGEYVYSNGPHMPLQKAVELSDEAVKETTMQTFTNTQGESIRVAKDKEGHLVGIYDKQGKAVQLSEEQMGAIANTVGLKTPAQEKASAQSQEKNDTQKGEKPGAVAWAERQQKWLGDNLGVLGSIAGHALLGPVKFFGNVLTGNFSEVLSMDTLKWLGSTGLFVGAGWGISSALKDNDNANVSGAVTDFASSTSGLSVENLFSGNSNDSTPTSATTQSTGSVSTALSNAGAQKVTETEEEKKQQQLLQQQSQHS